MPRTDPTLISQISKKHRDVVHTIYEHRGGNLSKDEFFHRNKEEWMTEPGFIHNTTQYESSLSNIKSLYRCTDEEAEAMVVASIYDSSLPDRGVARRVMTGDPDEMESALSLSARLDWLHRCNPSWQKRQSYPDIWFALRGLAAGDIDVARAIFRTRSHGSKGGHKPTVLIYDAVEAIVMKDREAQASIAPRIAKCNMPDWFRAVLETLQGVVEDDSSIVAAGLERVLATFRRQQDPFDYEMIVSLHAHALAELAYWVSPKLLAEFEVERALPWDRAYYRWLRRKPRSTAYRDLSSYSVLLNRWVHDLEEPEWWRREAETSEKEQPSSGSAAISESEEARGEESERVPSHTDGTRALLMIRAAAPARRNRAAHTLDLLDIGRPKRVGYGPDTGDTMIPWLRTVSTVHKNDPWLLGARFKRESWIHCIASAPELVSVQRLASNKDLHVLTANFDSQANRTVAQLFKNGSIAAEVALAGKGDDSLEVLWFKSSIKTKAFLKRCHTVRHAVDAFFAGFDAKARDLVVETTDSFKLMAPGRQAIRASELDELGITYYATLTVAENPP
jgi:hypothetical protein